MTNELLRAHLTRVGFDLSLGRTHVFALVQLDLSLKTNKRYAWPAGQHDLFVQGIQGCERRGLILHHYNQKAASAQHQRGVFSMRPHYSITSAGRLVLDLLKEAGLYEEYASAMVAA